jgi:hypothetical protein
MVAFGSGDLTPESWVPGDVASYTSLQWNVDETYEELERLYDIFRGPGAWQSERVGRLAQRVGINLEEEILAALQGRVTLITWMEKPARLNSQCTLVGLQLKDAAAFQATLQRAIEQFSSRTEKCTTGAVTYYKIQIGRGNGNGEPDVELTRIPQPCLGIVGDFLLLTDSEKLFQEVVRTKSEAALAGALDFKLIHSKIRRQAGDQQASMLVFQRPEESFRQLYELANQPALRDRMHQLDHPVARALVTALQEHPLPPFSVLAQYLAPSGALLVQDETGLHYTQFSLRRESGAGR